MINITVIRPLKVDVVAVTFVAVDGVEDDVVAALVIVDVATWVLLTYSLY